MIANVPDFLKGFHDKNESDQAGKVLFGESSDVADESGGVCGHQDNQYEAGPDSCPPTEGQILPSHGILAKLVHDGFEDQDGPSGS